MPSPQRRYQSAVLADRPVAFWPLGDAATATKAADLSGHHLDATYTGPERQYPGPVTGSTGARFSDNTFITAPDDPRLVLGHGDASDFSVEFWIQSYSGSPGVDANVLHQGDVCAPRKSAYQVLFDQAAGDPRDFLTAEIWDQGSGSGHPIDGRGVVGSDKRWHYAAAVFEGDQVWTYLDGTKAYPQPESWSPDDVAGPIRIGTTDCVTHSAIALANVAVYDRALSPVELADHLYSALPPVAPQGGPVTSRESAGGANAAEANCQVCLRQDPVNTMDGSLVESAVDARLPSRADLSWGRTYSSTLSEVDGPLGHGWHPSQLLALTEDPATGRVTLSQETGAEVVFTPDGSAGYSAPPRVQATLTRGGTGWVLTRGGDEWLRFDQYGRLTSKSGLRGDSIGFSYYEDGRPAEVYANDGGMRFRLTWSGAHIASVTDSGGRSIGYGYSPAGDLTTVTGVDGSVTRYGYDSAHRLTSILDPTQDGVAHPHPVTNDFDSAGRVVRQTDPLGGVSTFAYTGDPVSASGGTTVVTNASGHRTLDSFAYGQRYLTVAGYGTSDEVTERLAYDPVTAGVVYRSVQSAHDAEPMVWAARYDSRSGLPSSTIDGEGRTTEYSYNDENQPLRVTTPNPSPVGPRRVETTMTYDSYGNLTSRTLPHYTSATEHTDVKQQLRYTDRSHPYDVTEVIDEAGRVTRLAYDRYGNLTQVTTPGGRIRTTEYDLLGNPVSSVRPAGNVVGAEPERFTTTRTFDVAGRMLTESVANRSQPLVTTKAYGAGGRLASVTDPAGRTTSFDYDLVGHEVAVERPDGSRLRTSYWPDGALRSQTDAAGQVTSYAETALGEVGSVTDALGRTTTYTYASSGQVATQVDPSGRTTTHTYDGAGQPASVTYEDAATPAVRYAYNAAGLVSRMTSGDTAVRWSYDDLGRLLNRVSSAGTVGYRYDAAGQVVRISHPGGRDVRQAFDQDGGLVRVTDWLGNRSSFTYTPDGAVRRATAGNGVVTTYSYDDPGRLARQVVTSPGGAELAALQYTRNATGQVLNETARGIGGGRTHTYDALGRLASTDGRAYQYDTADRLAGLADGSTLTYDRAGGLRSTTAAGVTTRFGYDALGQRISARGGTRSDLGYTQTGLVSRATTGSGASARTAIYAYDGEGLRTAKTVDGTQARFAYDTLAPVPALLTGGATDYVYGPGGMPLEQVTDGVATYLHPDQLGSVRLLTSRAGASVGTATYSDHGQVVRTGRGSALGFAGQYADAETGNVHLLARSYDPSTAQFTTVDPVQQLTRQRYTYAGNDPVNAVDPSGRWAVSACLIGCVGYDSEHGPAVGFGAGVSLKTGGGAGLSKSMRLNGVGAQELLYADGTVTGQVAVGVARVSSEYNPDSDTISYSAQACFRVFCSPNAPTYRPPEGHPLAFGHGQGDYWLHDYRPPTYLPQPSCSPTGHTTTGTTIAPVPLPR